MNKPITSEIVVAYAQCPLKGYLLLCTDETGQQHEYVRILERQRQTNQARYSAILAGGQHLITVSNQSDLRDGKDYLIGLTLNAQGVQAECAALTRVSARSSLGTFSYEPTIMAATCSLTNEHKLQIAFAGLVLGYIQETVPTRGTVIGFDGHSHAIDLRRYYRPLGLLLNPLKRWADAPPAEPPPVTLNRHCPTCQFRTRCRDISEKADDLSLLDRMTPKRIRQYQSKGIFTVTQLSYLFRPRKSKKHPKGTATHKPELQALALRTGKTYLQLSPEVTGQPTELFLDIEGKPDQQGYYLIGLQIREGERLSHHSFWANTADDEQTIWTEFLATISAYPEAPIYHYGSYDATAIQRMARRYHTECDVILKQLINLTSHVYGKVYFPVRSNTLKDIGRFLGVSWTSPDASGLQSLVWRHHWEETGNPDDKRKLTTYNKEDCNALRRLLDELIRIREAGNAGADIDFADAPKRVATEQGEQLHSRFESLLLSAHAIYERKKVSPLRHKMRGKGQAKRHSHRGYSDAVPVRVKRVRHVAARETCPKHPYERLRETKKTMDWIVIDLAFTENGCRKTITRYVGSRGYCPQCCKDYGPDNIDTTGRSQLYGHNFQAWVVYQRLVLRLPYQLIVRTLQDQFNQPLSAGSIANFLSYVSHYYAETEERIVRVVLGSPFIHVDETKISIRGANHYVWVFTNGTHVFFRLTATREASIVHEMVSGYTGVLISDFYGGYDAVPCRQQKCLVHLIRDLNDDLWSHPLDATFEKLVVDINALITPMLADVERYGLKARHLQKHKKRVDAFYANIDHHDSAGSELVSTYLKRFVRYRASLFTFLEQDGLPWNNNTAERALRHLAVQRKISGSFFENAAQHYLLLLGLAQTCRFQGKSLLKFLLSGTKDIDMFRPTKRGRKSVAEE